MIKGMHSGFVMEAVSKDAFTSDRFSAYLPPEIDAGDAEWCLGT